MPFTDSKMLFTLFSVFITFVVAQTNPNDKWITQKHFSSASCGGTPYFEAAANLGDQQTCMSQTCSASVGVTPADFLLAECTGNTPQVTLSGGLRAETYIDPSCDTALQSVSVYVTNTCVSLDSASVIYLCDKNGAYQLVYSDTNCATLTDNVTLSSNGEGLCRTEGNGYAKFICGSSASLFRASGLIALILAIIAIAA